MHTKLIVLLVLFTLLLSFSTANAITWGVPDNGAHPYVGLLVFDINGKPHHRCSGTLISPTVVLTAGHCTDGTSAARIWFDQEVTDPKYPFGGGTSIAGTPHTNPTFNFGNFPATGDVGVVVLDSAVTTLGYGALPTKGLLDKLATQRGKQDTLFRPVGYGLQSVVPDLQADKVRYYATSNLVELGSALTDGYNLHTSNNPGKGNGSGGTCFGDSGGPEFYPVDSNVVVGVTSFGLNKNCVGADYAFRTDIDVTRSFLSNYVAVP
jgi:hypothetical protein